MRYPPPRTQPPKTGGSLVDLASAPRPSPPPPYGRLFLFCNIDYEQATRRGVPSWVPVRIVSANGTETHAYAAVYPLASSSSSPPSPPPSSSPPVTGDSAADGAAARGGGGGGGGNGGADGGGLGAQMEEREKGRDGGGSGDGREGEEQQEEGIHHALWEFHCIDPSTCVSIRFGAPLRGSPPRRSCLMQHWPSKMHRLDGVVSSFLCRCASPWGWYGSFGLLCLRGVCCWPWFA